MKLSISNIAWLKNEDNQVYEIMKEYKVTGLEIAPTHFFENPYFEDEKSILKIKKEVNQNKIEFSSMQSILYNKAELKLFSNEYIKRELINYLKRAIDFASILGIKNLVFGSPKNRVYKNKEDCSLAIPVFEELGEYALSKNTIFSIEANPREYNTNYINSTNEAIELVKVVNSKGFKVNLDLGTITMNNEMLGPIGDNLDLINHVHISEPFLKSIVNGNISLYKDVILMLREEGYDKFISIEMKKVDEVSNIDNVKGAFELVNKLLKG